MLQSVSASLAAHVAAAAGVRERGAKPPAEAGAAPDASELAESATVAARGAAEPAQVTPPVRTDSGDESRSQERRDDRPAPREAQVAADSLAQEMSAALPPRGAGAAARAAVYAAAQRAIRARLASSGRRLDVKVS